VSLIKTMALCSCARDVCCGRHVVVDVAFTDVQSPIFLSRLLASKVW
jgi:hypothetical protein